MPKHSRGDSRQTNEERPVQPVVGGQQYIIKLASNMILVLYMHFILVLVGDFEQFLEQQLDLDKVQL
jgi:hypothetical protein